MTDVGPSPLALLAELRDVVGSQFLEYLLAVEDGQTAGHLDTLTNFPMTSERADVVTALATVVHDTKRQYSDDNELCRMQIGHRFGQYVADVGMSLANVVRLQCGGGVVSPVMSSTIGKALAPLLRDIHPLLLLPHSNGPGSGSSAVMPAVFMHPGRLAVDAAVLADPILSRLFPEDGGDDTGDRMTQTIRSTGQGSTSQLYTFAANVMTSSWHWARITNKKPRFTQHCTIAEQVLTTLSNALSGEAASIPARIGIAGVLLPDSTDLIDFGWARLRRCDERDAWLKRTIDLDGRLQTTTDDGDVVSVEYSGDLVLEVDVAYRVRLHAGDLLEPQPDGFVEQHTLNKLVENLQLGLILASAPEKQRLAMPVWTIMFDPLSHGPFIGWRAKYQLGRLVPTRLQSNDVESWAKWTTRIRDKRVDNIDIAIRRTLRAVSERSEPEDILVDAVIVWENLFGSNQETVLRVTSALAWLLEPNSTDRRAALQLELKKLYALRSNIVHGNVKKSAALRTEPHEAVSIALRALSTLIEHRSDLLMLSGSDARSNTLLLGA